MHLTGHELALVPSVVAAVAIVGGYLGVRSANRNARALAGDQYRRDRRTETYLALLKAVHIRGVKIDEAFRLAPGQPSALMHPVDPVSDEEAQFAARIMAWATQEVYDLWVAFNAQTEEFEAFWIALRQQHGVPPAQVPEIEEQPDVVDANLRWRKARDRLINKVRDELEPVPPGLWRRGGRRLRRSIQALKVKLRPGSSGKALA